MGTGCTPGNLWPAEYEPQSPRSTREISASGGPQLNMQSLRHQAISAVVEDLDSPIHTFFASGSLPDHYPYHDGVTHEDAHTPMLS